MSTLSGEPLSRAASLPLVGGALALDFCNTSSGRGTPGHKEHLVATDHLLTWAFHASILNDETHAKLSRLCIADGTFAKTLLRRAIGLRDAIYRLDAALAGGSAPDQTDIDEIAQTHAACLAKARLTSREGGFGWTWSVENAPDEVVLGPLAASAMMILTAADRTRLKQCSGHHCGWLFLDTTKNNKRRWCEMEVCGNRAKQKRRRGRSEPDP